MQQPPGQPLKTLPSPVRISQNAALPQRLQKTVVLVNMMLTDSQPTTSAVVCTLAYTAFPNTSVTSSNRGDSEASAFISPQQDEPRMHLSAKTSEKGFFKSLQTTLVAGLGSIAGDFDTAITVQPEKQSVSQNQPSQAKVDSSSVPEHSIDTAVAMLNIGAHHSTSSQVQVTAPTISSPCPLCESSRCFEVTANPLEHIVIVCTCGQQPTASSLLCPVHEDPLKWSAATHPLNFKCTCPNKDKPSTHFGGIPQGKYSESTHQYTKFK